MHKIGIIGYGNMGSAIAKGIRNKYPVSVFDQDPAKTRKKTSSIRVAISLNELIVNVDTVILAIKPQDFNGVLPQIKEAVKDKLIISIAAGKPTKSIEKILGKVRVIRVMPNLPAKFGKGASSLCKGRYATGKDLDYAVQLFRNIGRTLIIEERMMNGATAVWGSGPGYFFDSIKGKAPEEIDEFAPKFATALTEAAASVGFLGEAADAMSDDTISGSVFYLKRTKLTPEEAKKQVVSKKGTTDAGLKKMHNKSGSLTDKLKAAVRAAIRRAKELSKS